MRAKRIDKQRGAAPTEFWLYFALVFILMLPVAVLRWLARLVVPAAPGEDGRRSVIGDAYARAWRITPQIFSV